MADVLEKTGAPLAKLGVASPEALAALFAELRAQADKEISAVTSADALEDFRVRWLGRKRGALTQVKSNWLDPAAPELKREVGRHLNALRAHLEAALDALKTKIEAAPAAGEPALDLSLPGLAPRRGARHLITQTIEEITGIFQRIGFSVVEGPEVETDYYNFEALNIPADHPARDTMDTFYVGVPARAASAELLGGHGDQGQRLLLRTHTSPMQIRTMEKQKPPVRVVVPGKTYRRDNPDASHSFMFHQIEGLAVDFDITFREFKGTMEYFLREFFGPKTRTRFQSSYFPFTEPSVDLAATCGACDGAGCRACKQSGWIELMGAGAHWLRLRHGRRALRDGQVRH